MPSISGLTTERETQHEVQSHQQYQPCNTNVVVHLDQTGRNAEHPGPNDASQRFPERELPRFRKEASILRTKTFGSHSSKARANDPPHENVWIAQRQYHTLPKGSDNHGQAATGQRMSHWGDMCEDLRRYLLYRLGLAGGISTSSDKEQHRSRVNEWVTECATHIFPSKN